MTFGSDSVVFVVFVMKALQRKNSLDAKLSGVVLTDLLCQTSGPGGGIRGTNPFPCRWPVPDSNFKRRAKIHANSHRLRKGGDIDFGGGVFVRCAWGRHGDREFAVKHMRLRGP